LNIKNNTDEKRLTHRGDIKDANAALEVICGKLKIEFAVARNQMNDFRLRKGEFEIDDFDPEKCVDSAVTWDLQRGIHGTDELARVASRVLKMGANSEGVERTFSKHARIHTKTRNRLKPKMAYMLLYIGWNQKELRKKGIVL